MLLFIGSFAVVDTRRPGKGFAGVVVEVCGAVAEDDSDGNLPGRFFVDHGDFGMINQLAW